MDKRKAVKLTNAAMACAILVLASDLCAQEATASKPFDFDEASRNVPKPREIWPLVREHTVPLEFAVRSDEIVSSDTDPSKKLRKVSAHFYSQELGGKKWGHPCVIFTPEANSRNLTPERKGKVVIVGSPGRDYFGVHVDKYGEPIATQTGYPHWNHREIC